ncbi:MAG: trypsin-like peptidase domain-containing protein [Chloroflexota bacterium]
MNFIDEHPLNFSRPEVIQLRDLFVSSYRRLRAAEQLADDAGIVAGTFPYRDDMRTTWTDLMNVMSLQGKLRTMIERAVQDPTTTRYHEQFRGFLMAQPAVAPMMPFSNTNWWKGPEQTRTLYLERLLEKRSRLVDIDIARQVAQTARSVAKLNLHFANELTYGTGFLIQPDRILTNHHNVLHESFGGVTGITAEFDYEQTSVDRPLVLRGNVDSIIKNKEHDWAVIDLEQSVGDRDLIALGTPFIIAKDDPVIIIQHPLGSFKQFALDPLSIQYVDDNVVQYLADTQDGSSGSPVFNIKMHLIALHHAEAELMVDVDNDGMKEDVWRNQGIHIDRVIEGLQAHEIPFIHNTSG